MPESINSYEGRLLASMLESQGRQLGRMQETQERIVTALESLGRLEERMNALQERQEEDRARVAAQEVRLQVVEVSLPPLKEIRRWVVGSVAASFGIVGTVIAALIVKLVH
jgi:predicted  nucleic acid-binding Zn-ribbon protein